METQKKGCLWPKSKRSLFLNYENNYYSVGWNRERIKQGDYDGRGQQSASPMLTAIMSGGVGISGRELSLSC